MIGIAITGTAAGLAEEGRYVIIHADDAGMCHSVNRATIEAMEQGVVSSASIMVPCPWFSEIAEYARNHPEQDFGVHLTLNAEWKHYRWGPVAALHRVPSLVDAQGFLWRQVADVAEHAVAEEVELELRAQIKRALEFGVPVTHLDTHMGALASRADLLRIYVKLGVEYDLPVLLCRSMKDEMIEQYPALAKDADVLLKTVEEKGLPIIDDLASVPVSSDLEASKAVYLAALERLKPGITQIIIHCGNDDAELNAVTNRAAHRDIDRRVFTDATVRERIKELGIQVVSWKQVRQMCAASSASR